MKHIQELVDKAKKSIPPGLPPDQWLEIYHQTFAELIVRECAEIADTERPNNLGCGYITKTKGMLIKEYFGVK